MKLAAPTPESSTAWTPARVRWAVLAVAALAGYLASLADAAPTGDPAIDAWFLAITVGIITWLGAAAMRWDAAVVTLVAGLTSMSIIGTIVGVIAAAAGFAVPVKPGTRSLVSAALVGVAMNLAARSELGGFHGASTLVALALAAYVGTVGFLRRPRFNRQVVAVFAGTFAGVAVAGTITLGVIGYLAADDLRDGNTFARNGLDHLREGDLDAARSSFASAADSFEAADRRLDTPLVAPAAYVPGLAQHRYAALELGERAAVASRRLSIELTKVDLGDLSVDGGRIDVEAVAALQQPLLAIQLQVEALQATLIDIDSPWLVPPVGNRLDDLAEAVAEQQQRSNDAITAAITAPAMLGAEEPRTYYIGFTTPAEARGSGGFMGNWAEVTIDDGAIELTGFGRADDLNEAGDTATRRFRTGDGGFDQWLARYGPYNLDSGPGGTTGPEVWKNINMSPDMATTGRAIAELYPQSGGGDLDGVFLMDVYTLSRLLEFTGPIELPEGKLVDGENFVTAATAAEFLLNDQYDTTRVDDRADILEQFSRSVIDSLLAGTLPPPTDLVDLMAPMVEQGRLTAWAADPSEQALFEQLGMAGTLPDAGTGDGVAVVFNNAVGNKIDYFLDASIDYHVDADGSTNTANGELTVHMTNHAPTDGEPGYVIGNPIGLDVGDNRTWVSVFTRLPVDEVRLDGRPVDIEVGAEAGYFVTSAFVRLPAGESATLSFTLEGRLDSADGYDLAVRTPPTVAPTPMSISASWADPDGVTDELAVEIRRPGEHRVQLTPAP